MRKYRKKQKKVNKAYMFFGVTVFCLIPIIFNDMGLLKMFELKKEQALILNDIDQLIAEEQWLAEEISKLKTDENYIQQIARERFHMVKPNEKVFRVIDNRKINE